MSVRVDLLEGARIALHSLRTNALRSLLTTVGIGIGVATLLAIVGIIQGLNRSFADQLATIGSNTLYASKFPWVLKGDWWAYRNRKNFTLAHLEAVRAQATHVTALAPIVGRAADVARGGEQLGDVRINGTTHEYLAISSFGVTGGRFLTEADDALARPVAVLGADVAEALFPGASPLGASLRIDERDYQVVGTLSRVGKVMGDSQDYVVFIPFKAFQAAFGKQRSPSLAMAMRPGTDLRAAEDQLVGILRRARATPPERPDDFSLNRPEQLAQTYEQLTGALYGVAVGVGLITLLVGGIGIMNIMLVSVRERTREIGVRRALGARRRTIVVQFLLEAAAVSAVGGLLGTAAGMLAAQLVSLVTPLPAAVRPLTVLGGVGFATAVGLLFGIWPAARAAQLDPVEALRHE